LNTRLKRLLRLLIGWSFILLGIAGLFLPVLQGILFLLIGLIILAPEYAWAQKLLHKLQNRFPKIFEHAHQSHLKVEEKLHRIFHRRDGKANARENPGHIPE
jgi:uncharacterized membrane protein YbaN (DUF454 family)